MPAHSDTLRPSFRLRRSPPAIAVVGATGAIGQEMLRVLEDRLFPVRELHLFASPRSAGKTLPFAGRDVTLEPLSARSFDGIDLALFSAGSAISREYAPLAVRQGAIVVDNASAFRMDPEVPLVVPEINAAEIERHRGIIANPNCAAIIALVPLWPIHRRNRVRRVILSTYQPHRAAARRRCRNCWTRPAPISPARISRRKSCLTPTRSTCSATTPPSTRRPGTTARRARSSPKAARSSTSPICASE